MGRSRVPLGLQPLQQWVYANVSNNSVVVDPGSSTIVATLPNIGPPVIDTATNRLYAANGSGAVVVIDGATNGIVGTLSLSTAASWVAPVGVNSAANRIYVSTSANELLIVDGATNTQVASVPVPATGGGRAGVDDFTGRVYVRSGGSQPSVTVIQDETLSACEADLTGAQQQIQSLESQVTALTSDNQTLASANATLQGQVATLTAQNQDLTSQNTALQGQVDSLTASSSRAR